MKKLTVCFLTIFMLVNVNAFSADNRSLLEKILRKDLPGGAASKAKKNKDIVIEKGITAEKNVALNEKLTKCQKNNDKSLLEKILRKDLPGGSSVKKKCSKISRQIKKNKTKQVSAISSVNNISLYTGTFDVIDKEGDDQSSLFGVEHKNPNLFRNTFLGKFSPITGAFMTGDSSVYIYTGIEGQYGIGPLKILPSFSPGYYEKGDGKDLGNVLEFKSEIKIGLNLFENSQLGYSYSHISNNDWGDTNPGTDNQQITFSKNF